MGNVHLTTECLNGNQIDYGTNRYEEQATIAVTTLEGVEWPKPNETTRTQSLTKPLNSQNRLQNSRIPFEFCRLIFRVKTQQVSRHCRYSFRLDLKDLYRTKPVQRYESAA